MVQWFKLFLMKMFGVKPYSYNLDVVNYEKKRVGIAIEINAQYRDSGVQSILKYLATEKAIALHSLAAIDGEHKKLQRVQGKLDALNHVADFIISAGAMSAKDLQKLKTSMSPQKKKGKVLRFGSSTTSRTDVSI